MCMCVHVCFVLCTEKLVSHSKIIIFLPLPVSDPGVHVCFPLSTQKIVSHSKTFFSPSVSDPSVCVCIFLFPHRK